MSSLTLPYPPEPVPTESIDKLVAASVVFAEVCSATTASRLAPYLEQLVLPPGTVVMREGEVAREILERYQRLSRPFGTPVEIEGNAGIVRL